MTDRKMPPIIRQLLAEHEVIETVLGSLYRWGLEGQDAAPEARAVFVAFFRTWSGGFHHGQEEDVLFPALVSRAEIPPESGPLRILAAEHREAARLVTVLEGAAPGDATLEAARDLAHLLWSHIDKENSVMLPEAGERLIRVGVTGLEGREEDAALARVRSDAEALIRQWPLLEDDEFYRGDGCMVCSAYGDTCGGIEKEWWNEWEWEHHRSFRG